MIVESLLKLAHDISFRLSGLVWQLMSVGGVLSSVMERGLRDRAEEAPARASQTPVRYASVTASRSAGCGRDADSRERRPSWALGTSRCSRVRRGTVSQRLHDLPSPPCREPAHGSLTGTQDRGLSALTAADGALAVSKTAHQLHIIDSRLSDNTPASPMPTIMSEHPLAMQPPMCLAHPQA